MDSPLQYAVYSDPTPGYDIAIRRTKRNTEFIAVYPNAYVNRHGERYYMGFTLTDGHVELTTEFVTRMTERADVFPRALKDAINRVTGYNLNIVKRLRG